jgi:protein-L-isoaspartate(D-aspartate) O-methyltransferase
LSIFSRKNDTDDFESLREKMVRFQIEGRGIRSERVLRAMREIPRHLFVKKSLREEAYGDHPMPIGEGQTISQPYMVALMTELLELQGSEKILEIGTGSGYQTAILSRLAQRVITIERIKKLSDSAKCVLDSMGISNVDFRAGDGTIELEEDAPFDGIIVTAGAPMVPKTYKNQLIQGGRLVIPVGNDFAQTLFRFRKTGDKMEEKRFTGCVFVKLIGKHGWQIE